MHIAALLSTELLSRSIPTFCLRILRRTIGRKVKGLSTNWTTWFQACERAGQKMYLFIDEYDHFTNAILSDAKSLHRYTDETHGEGYLRAFFNKVKAGTYSSIERCFITGVSPVTMDDLTSGFNIGTNYSLTPNLTK